MSAVFILEYGGMPVRTGTDGCRRPIHSLVSEAQATQFASEADAWHTAYLNNLSPNLCRVVNLHQRNQTPEAAA
jgi:hypothetical protein